MSEPVDAGTAIEQWVGRREQVVDTISRVQVRQLAAIFDDAARLEAPAADPLPAGWHWAYFNPVQVQSHLGPDGHPRRGGFLPPVMLPRRMWAGSRMQWERPFVVDRDVTRDSTILAVDRKAGRTGDMVFVTVAHRYADLDGVVLLEEHDIVYRDLPGASELAALAELGRRVRDGEIACERQGRWSCQLRADPVLLFRYSAATFNGHRIHFDADYARSAEGYPGLVVHGPLIATWLLGWAERELLPTLSPSARVAAFTFRAKAPTFDIAGFALHAEPTDDPRLLRIWSTNNVGQVGVDGELRWEVAT